MAYTQKADFSHYPEPVEGPETGYNPPPQNNPVLRGWTLLAATSLVTRSSTLIRLFWSNAGFPIVKDLPILDEVDYTFHPCVTPLGETGTLEVGDDLVTAKSYIDPKTKYYSVGDYHALYKSGKATPLDVAKALLPLTKPGQEGDLAKYHNAWADNHGNDELVLKAATASTERWAAGKPLGVLDGVPIGVKDDIDVKDYVSHNGMKYKEGLHCFRRREKSTWAVQKMEEAGAVIIGKNRMHEVGSDTNGLNNSQGTPTNHLNNAYYPGGSSSGPASALCAGTVPICLGTDAGGSIRLPAAFNGLYGLKPTHHRTGFMNSTMCVYGPMAANVADMTIAYRIMSQPDPGCSIQGRFAMSKPPGADAPRVIGVYRDWWEAADPAVQKACEAFVEALSARGYTVVDISLPLLPEAQLAHANVCLAEMAEHARRKSPNWLGLVDPVNKFKLLMGNMTPASDYLKFNAMRTILMRHLAFLFQKHPGLLILSPTSPLIGWPKAKGDEPYGLLDANTSVANMMYIFVSNMTGTPSVNVPVAYVEPRQGKGTLSVGLQATAEWGAEEQLLAFAAEAEEYIHETGRRRPDSWLDVLALVQS